jgi:hypothetical protein
MILLVIFFSIAAVLAISGSFLVRGKLLDKLAGYDAVPDDEKTKQQGKLLGRATGIFSLCMAALTVITGVVIYLLPSAAAVCVLGWLGLMIIGITILIFLTQKT